MKRRDSGDKVGDASGKHSLDCSRARAAFIDLSKSREPANPAGALSFQLKDGIQVIKRDAHRSKVANRLIGSIRRICFLLILGHIVGPIIVIASR